MKEIKIPTHYGYAIMATKTQPYHVGGQFNVFRLKRDAEAYADEQWPDQKKEIRNCVIRISIF